MKYILYFGGYDNNTYFYNSINELLKDWNYRTLECFIASHKKDGMILLKIEKVVYNYFGGK